MRVGRMIFRGRVRVLSGSRHSPGRARRYAGGRGMSALLFGIAPGDPVAFAVGVGLALVMALAGCIVPTLSAVSVTPMWALQAE